MVRRSVVVEPPKPSRRSSVAKGASGRVIAIDSVIGVVGILLILGSASLVYLLPEVINKPPEPLPQFRVGAVIEQSADEPSQSVVIQEQTAHQFGFEVAHDNAVRIQFSVYFEDDVEASKPDRFQIKLISPAGEIIGETQFVSNTPPVGTNGVPPGYSPGNYSFDFTFNINQEPRAQITTATHRGETLEAVQDRVAEANHVATKGTWFVEVFLEDAGDCPDPTELAGGQTVNCRGQAADGEDVQNEFIVETFNYQHFRMEATSLNGGA